jgi:hypothetical protein
LPEVTEKQHFRFRVPLWQVGGKTFLGMGRDEGTAVFCIPEAAGGRRTAIGRNPRRARPRPHPPGPAGVVPGTRATSDRNRSTVSSS